MSSEEGIRLEEEEEEGEETLLRTKPIIPYTAAHNSLVKTE